MTDSQTINLDFWFYISIAMAITLLIVRLNRRIKEVLTTKPIADIFIGNMLLVLLFYIFQQFMLWWIAAIAALLLMYIIDNTN